VLFFAGYLVYIGVSLLMSDRLFKSRKNSSIIENDDECELAILANVSKGQDDENFTKGMEEETAKFGEEAPLAGLSWDLVKNESYLAQTRFVLEYPFSLLRWLSVPLSDGEWGPKRKALLVYSPIPFACVFLTSAVGTSWMEFTPIMSVIFIGMMISFLLEKGMLRVEESKTLIGIFGLIGAISWLHIIAGEVVSLAESLGITFGIPSVILGSVVISTANSVGDLMANLSVAKNGMASTAVTACFATPLLTHLIGLGIGFAIQAVKHHPVPFELVVNLQALTVDWIFLIVAILSSMLAFWMCKFTPPKAFGVYLIALYLIFAAVSVMRAMH